jgi:hypothetical protein
MVSKNMDVNELNEANHNTISVMVQSKYPKGSKVFGVKKE